MSADPDQLASAWLRVRRHFEAEAGKGIAAKDRLRLRDLTMEQLAVLARTPPEGIDEASAKVRFGLVPKRFDASCDEMVALGLLCREPGEGGTRIRLTETGLRTRATLDLMQKRTLLGMIEAVGPELAARMVAALGAAFPERD